MNRLAQNDPGSCQVRIARKGKICLLGSVDCNAALVPQSYLLGLLSNDLIGIADPVAGAVIGTINHVRLLRCRVIGNFRMRSTGRPSKGVSIFCNPAMRWFVSRARSVRSLIWSSFTVTWLRKNSFSPSRRSIYRVSVATSRDWSEVVGPSCRCSFGLSSGTTCRDRSGPVATGRTSSM